MNISRIMLAGGSSGSGKTLITCGILQALVQRGFQTASFKCGPDYIDPMFHSRVIGAKSRNLDTFFTDPEVLRYLLACNCADSRIAVMEGVMGYYDGVAGTTTKASAYDLADVTDTPVILIVNSKGMSVSLAAYIKGFLEYKKDSYIRGVIFNQMSPMLYPRMKKMIEDELGIPVFGYVPKVEDCVIESRHLGLVLPEEIPELKMRLERLAEVLEKTLELDEIIQLADSAPPIIPVTKEMLTKKNPAYGYQLSQPVRIAVADDEAFCFFYEDNFRLLQEMGAELVRFSPIHDNEIPEDTDGILLYGGYPELKGKELEENIQMRNQLKNRLEEGMPCMAECGGFMYLHEEMEDIDGNPHRMVGAVSGKAFKTNRLGRFGYITMEQKTDALGDTDLGKIPAHEFHYFDSDNCGSDFEAKKPFSNRGWQCIHGSERMMAGFPHLYYYGNPEIAKAFLTRCLEYKRERKRMADK